MDELRAGDPIAAGDVTLVPIERCSFEFDTGGMGCWLYGLKEPFAIIFCDANGVRAFNTKAARISVESLIQKISDLGALLEPLSP
jgi:uncharacterized spore protein YtfJ